MSLRTLTDLPPGMLNESMELNSRGALPLDTMWRLRHQFSAQPLVSAAVAHFRRWDVNPKLDILKGEAGKISMSHLILLCGVLLLALQAGKESGSLAIFGTRTQLCGQNLAEPRWSESQNLELEKENRRLEDSHQATMIELARLQREVQQFQNASNVYFTFVDREIRTIIGENEELAARAAGKPRVPRVGAWVGINVADLEQGDGIVVKGVVYHSPAAKADVEAGDIIEAVDGTLVKDAESFKGIPTQKAGGQALVLDVIRDNAPLKVEVIPVDWPL